MEISVNEHRQIRLKNVFEPIELVSPDGETLTIAMRDGGFEIGIGSVQPHENTLGFSFYRTRDGEIEPMAMEDSPLEGESHLPAHIGIVGSKSEWGKEPIPDSKPTTGRRPE